MRNIEESKRDSQVIKKQGFSITDVARLLLFSGVPASLLEQISSEMVRFDTNLFISA